MGERRIDDLFTYLDLLSRLRNGDGGYVCTREIRECIDEIKTELVIVSKSE